MKYNRLAAKGRQQARLAALSRPELRQSPHDVLIRRQAPASPISAPIKVVDAETRRLIDEAVAKRSARS
jgi:hypothetical protein